jgi:hypothetical protein
MPPEDIQRSRAIERLKGLLLRRGNPYGHMLLILLATGCAAFLSSKLLHAAGLTSMGIRYPIAVVLGYLVFLMLVGIWVSFHNWRARRAARSSSVVYNSDPGPYVYLDPFPQTSSAPPLLPNLKHRGGGQGGGGWGGGDWGGDGEGVAIVIVILVAIGVIAALGASVYVVIEAPALFGEVLLNSAILAGFSRRLRTPQEHWTTGVIRRTWLAAIGLAMCFALIGFGLEYLVPKATTLGEAWTKSH